MAKIGIFYGSSTGNTEKIADLISESFGDDAIAINVEDASVEELDKYPYLIFGVSTWEIGDMQEDWVDFAEMLKDANLKDKKVAIFGLGDQEAYDESFADGAGKLYTAISRKTTVVGQTSTKGYDFVESEAVKNKKFVGLIIDEDNQKELTSERVKAWVEQLKKEFK
jgi:flavodoxin I